MLGTDHDNSTIADPKYLFVLLLLSIAHYLEYFATPLSFS
uniref:Uncharacterized protein MANES_04G135600 n=1 Tax=Rhizophora mucronata TaxID=61149 RepID=A0A2P2M5U6_RHIMU